VAYGNQNWSTAVQGSPPSYLNVRDWPLSSGRFFTDSEEDSAAKVAVLGQTPVDKLFLPGEEPIGATIRARGVPFKVIGVLASKGQTSWGQDQDDVVLVPFSTAERRVLGTAFLGTVNMMMVSANSPSGAVAAEEEIRRLLQQRHRTPPGQDDDFTVRSMAELFEMSATASRVMTNLLATIASISLLVGGIGIMNILLVSVTERTREIGIRMAVGAKGRHILAQFLSEAVALSALGGVIGIVLGIGVAHVISQVSGWPTLVSPLAVVGSFLFSAAVGVFFGFYPARKASRLNPIAALRHD
jgi:putative ABC transport system permease protein